MQITGKITNVYYETTGSELAVDAAINATVLSVIDAFDFEALGNRTLELNGVQYTYTAVDIDAGTILIPAPGLTAAAVAGDDVLAVPYGQTKWAQVTMEDDEEGIQAYTGAFTDKLDDGIRDDFEQEAVVCDDEEGRWIVRNLEDDIPLIGGAYVDVKTLPPISDGLPPAAITAITADGGIGNLFLSWTAVTSPDPVTYDVYVSNTNPVVVGSGTFIGSTNSTVFVKNYPAGTLYAKVVARDADGSAAASPQVSAAVQAPVDTTSLQTQIDANKVAVENRPRAIFAATQPTLLATEKAVWYDSSNGYAASYWDGSTWAPYSLSTGALAPNTVTAALIANGAVIAGKIGALAVTAAEVAANAITTTKIATDAVTAAQIAAGAVASSELATGAVLAAAIAANAVTTAAVAADAITAAQVAANAVGSSELSASAVIAGKIAAGTIVAGDIATGAITAGKVAALAITATEIAAGAIIAGKIAAGAVTATELAAGSVIAGKIAAGTVVAGDIAAGAIVAGKIATNAVTAGTIAAGAVVAASIAAGAITTDKLTVASLGTDLVRDGGFEEATSWVLGATATRVSTAAHGGTVGLSITASGGVGASSQSFPVGVGDILSVGCWAIGRTLPTGLYLRVSWRNSADVELGISDAMQGVAVPGAWTRYTGTFAAAPANTVKAVFQLYNTAGTVDIDDITVRPVVVSAQIADGAIIAAKVSAGAIVAGAIAAGAVVTASLAAGAVVAASIAADTITAAQIAANAITVTELAAGAVTAVKVQAGAITANEIATGTIVANRLAAGTITANEIAAGTITGTQLSFTAIDGKTITGAILQTAASSTRVTVQNIANPFEANSLWGMIQIYNSNTLWYPGQIWGQYSSAVPNTGTVALTSPFLNSLGAGTAARINLTTTDGGATQLDLISKAMTFSADTFAFNSTAGSVDFNMFGTNVFVVEQGAGSKQGIAMDMGGFGFVTLRARASTGSQPQLRLDGNGIFLLAGAAGTSIQGGRVTVTSGGVGVTGNSSFSGQLDIGGTGNTVAIASPPTGGTANVNWNSVQGNLRLITSTMRHKMNIRSFEFDLDSAYALTPSIYKRIDRDLNDPEFEVGFIAEEAEARGLTQWLMYDSLDEVYSFDYFRWVVALQAMARDLNSRVKRVEKHETRIARLERKVAALLAA